MPNNQTPDEMIKLHTDQWVRRSEYNKVVEAVRRFLPSMRPKHSYPVETMVGQAIWSKGSKRRTGAIIAHAVRYKELPLRFANNGKRATKLYELDV